MNKYIWKPVQSGNFVTCHWTREIRAHGKFHKAYNYVAQILILSLSVSFSEELLASAEILYTPIQPVSQNQKFSHRRHVLNCRFVNVISCVIFRYVYDPAVCRISHASFQYPFTGISGSLKKIFSQPPCCVTIYSYISLKRFVFSSIITCVI